MVPSPARGAMAKGRGWSRVQRVSQAAPLARRKAHHQRAMARQRIRSQGSAKGTASTQCVAKLTALRGALLSLLNTVAAPAISTEAPPCGSRVTNRTASVRNGAAARGAQVLHGLDLHSRSTR